MKSIQVEGWRFIPHSYAMVSQHFCLELLHRDGITLYHRDVPYAAQAWRPGPPLFSPADEARLRAIPSAPPGARLDAVLRAGWPHFFHADPMARRTFVWATSELQIVEDIAIGIRRPAAEVLPRAEARIIACSTWAAEGFINSGAPRDRVSVVPCGVDPAVFAPAAPAERDALRKQLGWSDRFVILNVSAMTPNKGIARLLRAVARLAPAHPALSVVLKGTDSLYRSRLMAEHTFGLITQAEAAAVRPRVTYIGDTLTAHALARYYRAADAYVAPYTAEGFNLPVLEAAACGLPVLCTAGGSTEDFIDGSFALRINSVRTPAEKGMVSLSPDQDHLVAQLERLLADGAFRAAARESGPRWVRDRFTWQHAVDALLKVMFAD